MTDLLEFISGLLDGVALIALAVANTDTGSLLLPVVNDDQGPVAEVLISSLREFPTPCRIRIIFRKLCSGQGMRQATLSWIRGRCTTIPIPQLTRAT